MKLKKLKIGGHLIDFEKSKGTKSKFHFSEGWLMGFRPYTAESVVAKRGTMKIDYASNAQAKKLFALLEEHAKVSSLANAG
jgi:isocitrate lyase